MGRNILIAFILLTGLSLFAQEKDVHSFIPKNYEILNEGIAKGDLNKDGIEDVALALYPVLGNNSEWMQKVGEDSLPERLLVILFGTKTGLACP